MHCNDAINAYRKILGESETIITNTVCFEGTTPPLPKKRISKQTPNEYDRRTWITNFSLDYLTFWERWISDYKLLSGIDLVIKPEAFDSNNNLLSGGYRSLHFKYFPSKSGRENYNRMWYKHGVPKWKEMERTL